MGHPYGDKLLIRPAGSVVAGASTQRTNPQQDTPRHRGGRSNLESRRAPTPASPASEPAVNTLTVKPRQASSVKSGLGILTPDEVCPPS